MKKILPITLWVALFLGTLQLSAQTDSSAIFIFHTNDVHSRLDAFPADYPVMGNQGGYPRRAALIDSMRQVHPYMLLFDSGDMVQGTPYFNFFNGRLEIELMNRMGYDAVTIGNHEFDNGLDSLAARIREAHFPFVNCNYDFSNTPVDGLTRPYVVLTKGKWRIGVVGVGVSPAGLVDPVKWGDAKYLDPVPTVNRYAAILKQEEKCDYVICLSHLGYDTKDVVNDCVLAGQSHDIDVILGGHTHSVKAEPARVKNADGKVVLISQCGWGGVKIGWVSLSGK